MEQISSKVITIPVDGSFISGDLSVHKNSRGIIIFAHGAGSSRFSERNIFVAQVLQEANFSTLLFDLLTQEEEKIDVRTQQFRFDIPMLANRLMSVTQWVQNDKETSGLSIGYFGASTGAAAALIAAGALTTQISAVVSRGGRPDLAVDFLPQVTAPTLLIVGELDTQVITLNEFAYDLLACEKELSLVQGASHLFDEQDTLKQAANRAAQWFVEYME